MGKKTRKPDFADPSKYNRGTVLDLPSDIEDDEEIEESDAFGDESLFDSDLEDLDQDLHDDGLDEGLLEEENDETEEESIKVGDETEEDSAKDDAAKTNKQKKKLTARELSRMKISSKSLTIAGPQRKATTIVKQKSLAVPLEKPHAERLHRTVAYSHTQKDIGKWQPVVKRNREADRVILAEQPVRQSDSTSALTAAFSSRTPLEQEIQSILEESSIDEGKIKRHDELKQSTLTAEEVKARNDQLAKLRSLLFFQEMKAKRQKKIKSRTYRRIKKKARLHAKMNSTSYDEEEEKLLQQQQLKDRATERMTLKHKGQSKWSKRQLKHLRKSGRLDESTKAAMEAQYRKHQELTKKINEHTPSGSESESDSDVEEDQPAQEQQKGIMGMKFMVEAEKRRKLRYKQEKEREELMTYQHSSDEDGESDKEEELPTSSRKVVRTGQVSVAVPTAKPGSKKAAKSAVSEVEAENLDQDNPWLNPNANDHKLQEALSTSSKSTEQKSSSKKERNSSKKRKQNVVDKHRKEAEAEMQDRKRKGAAENPATTPHPSPVPARKNKTSSSSHSDSRSQKKSFDLSANVSQEQQDLIKEAFPDAQFEEEFLKEKMELEEAQKEQPEPELPGWGSWGGSGIKPKVKRQRTEQEKKTSAADNALRYVIVNEHRNKKSAKYLVNKAPFPFTSTEQYERSLQTPLGNDWNTSTVHQDMIQPKFHKRQGDIIAPISMPKKQKKRKNRADEAARAASAARLAAQQRKGVKKIRR